MLDKKTKDKIIQKFQTHKNDTGSTEIQIALLTEEIKQLAEHLKRHKKDFSSRRGLLMKVGERRALLHYLEKENEKSYLELCKKLKIKTIKKREEERVLEEELFAEVESESEKEKIVKEE
jgi:small subunit ribosomal protein S15